LQLSRKIDLILLDASKMIQKPWLRAIFFALDDIPEVEDNFVVEVLPSDNAFQLRARRILCLGDVQYCIVLLASCRF
jgi:hypothetical protein